MDKTTQYTLTYRNATWQTHLKYLDEFLVKATKTANPSISPAKVDILTGMLTDLFGIIADATGNTKAFDFGTDERAQDTNLADDTVIKDKD